MGRLRSLPGKAAHFVSDLTTVFLNPISDQPSKPSSPRPPENLTEPITSQSESVAKDDSEDLVDEPDTSSFPAFVYALLSSSESGSNSNLNEQNDRQTEAGDGEFSSSSVVRESGGKKSLFSKGKHTLSRAVYYAVSGYRQQGLERKGNRDKKTDDGSDTEPAEEELQTMNTSNEPVPRGNLPDISEPSSLLPEKTRSILYASLPAIVQGRKWVLLYSTWRNGISLSTLYRRSMLWPGLSLLVVGDRKGAVFGGLVEAPLRPTSRKKYQGTNNSFVFTNAPGHPVIFRPTGANRYFTLCSMDSLAMGGGDHFALYLDSDLLIGSSGRSETYDNCCLAHTQDFDVKEVELWGFVYQSKYEEVTALCRKEDPGIARW
ncbi:uncharacterized protein LOC131159552 isoform X2 [Malania oleifera]|uniref:uncharacterized protein LOC131159552 isoform X2 n=1 Tax=Malania oleifera TaxID=397392 RepID=UPI0025AE0770|nr:uncharacterized protein LOC131159552 isoform X2 [Malania oleifera]